MMSHPPDDETDDADLIRAAQRGDLTAYEKLVVRYQAGVRAFAAVRIPMRYEAEDLAQEAFLIAWRKLHEFDPDTSFGAWLKAIAHRLVMNHRRKFRAEGVGGHAELEILLHHHDAEAASDRLAALRDCLSLIDGPALKLLNARYLDGVSVKDIAKQTGKGYSALTMQLFRLRELLAACVETEMSTGRNTP
jgi:RNA polymerase sigma-70 factor (ECF subfamily)